MMYFRWFLIMLFNLFGFLTTPIIFPIVYLTRDNRIFSDYLLWIYHDDEDGLYGSDWWRKDRKKNFWTAYKWTLRNPMWNGQTLSTVTGERHYISHKGWIMKGKNYDLSVFENCVLKWLDKNFAYSDNKGKYLSLKHSILGSMFVKYSVNGKRYWKYTSAKKLFWRIWWEFQVGITTRYTFRLKLKYINNII